MTIIDPEDNDTVMDRAVEREACGTYTAAGDIVYGSGLPPWTSSSPTRIEAIDSPPLSKTWSEVHGPH